MKFSAAFSVAALVVGAVGATSDVICNYPTIDEITANHENNGGIEDGDDIEEKNFFDLPCARSVWDSPPPNPRAAYADLPQVVNIKLDCPNGEDGLPKKFPIEFLMELLYERFTRDVITGYVKYLPDKELPIALLAEFTGDLETYLDKYNSNERRRLGGNAKCPKCDDNIEPECVDSFCMASEALLNVEGNNRLRRRRLDEESSTEDKVVESKIDSAAELKKLAEERKKAAKAIKDAHDGREEYAKILDGIAKAMKEKSKSLEEVGYLQLDTMFIRGQREGIMQAGSGADAVVDAEARAKLELEQLDAKLQQRKADKDAIKDQVRSEEDQYAANQIKIEKFRAGWAKASADIANFEDQMKAVGVLEEALAYVVMWFNHAFNVQCQANVIRLSNE